MKNHTYIAKSAKQATIIQMIASISLEDAHAIHIPYEIAKIDNETGPTSLKKITLEMFSSLS